jgi:hypothetical protein
MTQCQSPVSLYPLSHALTPVPMPDLFSSPHDPASRSPLATNALPNKVERQGTSLFAIGPRHKLDRVTAAETTQVLSRNSNAMAGYR